MEFIVLFVAVALSMYPLARIMRKKMTRSQMKMAFISNIAIFSVVCIVAFAVPFGQVAFAETAVETAATNPDGLAKGLGLIAAALVTGMACIGCGMAVAAAAPAAIGAMSEDPKSFGKALIFVALGEGVAIYGLLISILILGEL